MVLSANWYLSGCHGSDCGSTVIENVDDKYCHSSSCPPSTASIQLLPTLHSLYPAPAHPPQPLSCCGTFRMRRRGSYSYSKEIWELFMAKIRQLKLLWNIAIPTVTFTLSTVRSHNKFFLLHLNVFFLSFSLYNYSITGFSTFWNFLF